MLGASCVVRGASSAAGQAVPRITPQRSGATVVLQAVSAPDARTAWVTGHGGVVLRTTDGGATWQRRPVPDADSLQFREVHALDAATAWILAAGPGARSRIYHTNDGGATWALQFLNADSAAFYDCFAFWDAQRGVVFSDGVIVRVTLDGGARWDVVPADALPTARPGEGAFAASGTCVVTVGARHAWIGTGATDSARVLRTADGGRSWAGSDVPIAGGSAAGTATVAFRDTLHGATLGGDLARPRDSTGVNVALTSDGGRTWRAAGRTALHGAVYGAVFVPGTTTLVAVGPGGMDWSTDGGATWTPLGTVGFWAVGFAPDGAVGWAVGPEGRIVRIEPR
jgi:photosystem II stability/assembly factor-like uncharacterized protein